MKARGIFVEEADLPNLFREYDPQDKTKLIEFTDIERDFQEFTEYMRINREFNDMKFTLPVILDLLHDYCLSNGKTLEKMFQR